ncbi:MAG: SDR family NAD(P)-dependent oxidoreductase [Rickettsiales bacterium]
MGVLEGRLALVTGASRGIGAAVAKRFAKEGAHVIAIARSSGGLEALDDAIRTETGKSATLVPLDLTNHAQIDELGGVIAERYGKLDIFVGNAAILGTLGPLGHIKPAIWEQVMKVNVNANWRFIRSLDPLLRASDAGRAMFVTSSVAKSARAYWGAYATSKAALEMLVNIYAAETEKTNLRVNLVDPGVVRTSMRKEAFPGEDASQHPIPDVMTDVFVELASPGCTARGERKHATPVYEV